MQIKRFEAKNMTKALSLIKNELGPEAVILSARSLRQGKGIFGSMKYAGVEVTAAIDVRDSQMKTGQPASANPAYPLPSDRRSNSAGKGTEPKIRPPAGYPGSGYGRRSKAAVSRSGKSDSNNQRLISMLYQQMLSQGIDRHIASRLIDELKRIPAAEDLISNGNIEEQLVSMIEELGIRAHPSEHAPDLAKMAALIGPTGVGKTTTIAKLAAVQAKRHQKQVALVSIDNYGIAANGQLKTFARIMGIPLETAVNKAEFRRAIKAFGDKDLILIDTPGINPTDPSQIRGLFSYFDKMPDVQKHLVVSVATREDNLREICQTLQKFGIQRLLFTKIDESRTHGNMLNMLMRTHLPLSYMSCGRKVPDDIAAGTIRKLVGLIFQVKDLSPGSSNHHATRQVMRHAKSGGSAFEHSHFMANKNSDVYHHTGCKWSHRIKSVNIIRFDSQREAEAQNFLPCRSCNPDRLKNDEARDLKTVTRKFSSNQ
ncbi:Flagellar biosynthesis protein FlhF [Olavius algarvensis Delta 1 endosymbiont]|nr:Flagellar biosynthesis protein FlhF [Olavius algarvensis Delta 1 endosymbiont]